MPPQPSCLAQIAAQLKTNKGLVAHQAWLETCLSNQRPATPIYALYQTALFRLLASDITTSLEPIPSTCLPADIRNATLSERRLLGPIIVQVLEIEDMSKSRWEQIEAIEALERGEGTKGREIIRVAATEEGNEIDAGATRGGPHKLLLQDAKGITVYGIELVDIEGLSLSMSIGSKMALKNVAVARGVLLLEPTTTVLLGGKIETLHESWKANRKMSLKAAIEANGRASAQ